MARRKIQYNGNSKVIKRLCEWASDDSLEARVDYLQETLNDLIARVYGQVKWATDTADVLITHEGDEIVFVTGGTNLEERVATLEDMDYLTYYE